MPRFGPGAAFSPSLGYLWRVSILETTLIYVGIPVVIIAVMGALCYPAPRDPSPRPARYTLDKKWTRQPVLWSAVDEVTVRPGQHGAHAAIAAGSADLIGGSASGRW